MKRIGIITAILLIPAIITGFATRASIVESKLENYKISPMRAGLAETLEENMEYWEEEAVYILKVRCASETKFNYLETYQEVEVLKSFRGNMQEGEHIYVSPCDSCIFLNKKEAPEIYKCINMNFVNAMRVGKEYLVFLQEGVTSEELRMTMYDSAKAIPTLFLAYESVENVTCDAFNVPYAQMKDNEFFAADQETLELMEAWKKKVLERYP